MTTQSHLLRRRLGVSVCGVMGVGAAVLSSSAQVTLTDGNSVVDINPNTQAGAYNWLVDGQDQLTQQWFWYRLGTTAEASIDTLTLSGVVPTGSKQAELSYIGSGFTLSVTYNLTGGTAGSGVSDLAEQLQIINTSGGNLDFHLFGYSDFDLAGTASGDTVDNVSYLPVGSSPGYGSVTQSDGLSQEQTTLVGFANRADASAFPLTLNALNDGSATSLANSGASFGPVGPGDLTYAFQWDLSIANGGSKTIAFDKRLAIQPIPEPTTTALSLVGLAALWRASRKRRV